MGGVAGTKFIKKDIRVILNILELDKFIENKNVYVAGSYRRDCTFMGDIDLIIDTNTRVEILRHLESKLGSSFIKVRGDFINGMLCQYKLLLAGTGVRGEFIKIDFKFVEVEDLPFMLLHFTGSNFLNIALRNKAEKKGFKLNEYGIYEAKTSTRIDLSNTRFRFNNEADIFNFLGYEYIPTNLRSANSIAEAFTILKEFQL